MMIFKCTLMQNSFTFVYIMCTYTFFLCVESNSDNHNIYDDKTFQTFDAQLTDRSYRGLKHHFILPILNLKITESLIHTAMQLTKIIKQKLSAPTAHVFIEIFKNIPSGRNRQGASSSQGDAIALRDGIQLETKVSIQITRMLHHAVLYS